jgi:xylulokinase
MFIGVDIGTSSTKGVVIDDTGAVVAAASVAYDFDRPHPGWAQTNPRLWWDATRRVLGELVNAVGAAQIKAIGLSGQMHGSVFLDAAALEVAGAGEPVAISEALMWNDQRTASQCAAIIEDVGSVRTLVERVGNAPLTGFTLPKILWLRDTKPEAFGRLAAVCNPKDFVRLCLTGRLATDVGDASGTLLFDVERRAWSREIIDAVGLDAGILPPVLESGAVAGELTPWAAAETGLVAGLPIVAGSGDNQCGGIGAGVVAAGGVLITLGTSGVVFAHSSQCVKDLGGDPPGRVHTMCSATGTGEKAGAWTITGCMLSAGGSLEWARGLLAEQVSFDELMLEAGEIRPGSDGLMFMPHLTGERCPHADPEARGAWIGLTRNHTRAALLRSVVEGVSLGIAEVLDLVESLVGEATEIRLGGGGAKSSLWRQVLADTLGRDLVSMAVDEGPAHGAALLAAVQGGAFATIEEAASAAVGVSQVTSPGQDAAAQQALRPVYARLYPAMRETMHTLGQL